MTTFHWSFGEAVPTRTQIFVSRSGVANPFEAPLRVFEVDPPTDTSFALTDAEALTIGDELSWGLRIETADEVLFTFEGQIGETFTVAENVPPSGQLLAPENEFILADDGVLAFDFEADAENCEDVLALTFALEFLGTSSEPDALFDSETQVTATPETAPSELAGFIDSVDLVAGRWAWGVRADDGTDATALPDADNPDRTFRTFIREAGPLFVVDPAAGTQNCADGSSVGQGLAFTFEDGNGAETVTVTVTFAAREADVFDAPEATLALEGVPTGGDPVEVVVFLEALEPSECVEFVHGLGFYGVELDDGVNDPVQQAAEYAGPPIGACCSTDGFCEDLLEADCTHGIYQGDGTSCSTFECPILTGACCLPQGSCTDGLEDQCLVLEGTYQGTGTQCATTECPILTGACCLSDGSCTEGFIEACFGTFQGTGTTCATIGCPPPPPTVLDCNTNGVPDDQDIASGTSNDCDLNGVPDECEGVGSVVDAGTLAVGTLVGGVYES
ncbi:MAG: hypothetical protein GY778_18525, partial [bacterium]|nr:hypothetical protein [bacterium]